MTPDPESEEPSSIALIAGATGAIGRCLLPLLAESGQYDRVVVVGRSAPADLPENAQFHEADLVNGSLVEWLPSSRHAYCCLGTTASQAGSIAEFERLEKGMIYGFARMARDAGVTDFALVSSLGASPDAWISYSRIKGEIEQELTAMEFEHLHIFQPSLLLSGPRPDSRPGESIGQMMAPVFNPLMIGPLARYRAVRVEKVAADMLAAMTGPAPEHAVTMHYPSETI